jgi:trimethylamine-N-oxide reductase (cytochrome c)
VAKEHKTKNITSLDKSAIKGGSLSGGQSGYPCVVDMKDGKIVRIRPLHYDWHYTPEQFNPWKMKARGQTFEPGLKTLVSISVWPIKEGLFANRILYPLKRGLEPERR